MKKRRTKQRMPVPHPLMNRSYNPEVASTHVRDPARERIGRYLPGDLMRTNRAKFDEALNRISIAVWRYSESCEDTDKFPTVKKHRDNLTSIRDRAKKLKKLLKAPDTETYRRLFQQLGQKHPDDHYQLDEDGMLNPIDEEIDEYNDGKRQYAEIESLLEHLVEAAEKVIDRLPDPRGRPDKVAPPLETSFAHAVADVWCRVAGESFVGTIGVAGKDGIRSNQGSAKFLEIVLKHSIPGITDERLNTLIKKVAKQRFDEAENPATGRGNKSGRGGRPHY